MQITADSISEEEKKNVINKINEECGTDISNDDTTIVTVPNTKIRDILKDENIDENNEQKKIEVITGDGDLNISPVYDHIEVEKPKPKDTREVIVPEVKDTVNKADTTE